MSAETSSRSHTGRTLFVFALLLVVALLAVAGATWLSPHGLVTRPLEMTGWLLLASLASLHRPLGGKTLALGTFVLPAALTRLGAGPAALIVGFAFLLSTAARSFASRRLTGRRQLRRGDSDVWIGVTLVFAATLAAAPFWASPQDSTYGQLAALASYPMIFSLLHLGRWRLQRRSVPLALHLLPLSLDVCGWALGWLTLLAASAAGWTLIGMLAGGMALLCAEAARNALLREASEDRLWHLERLQLAHERILAETGMGAIAAQILTECRNFLPVFWFQFELQVGSEHRSWEAGPDGLLREGRPVPPAQPPALPGIHRRVAWQIFEKPLVGERETLAIVRLWCDPRRIESGAEELLEKLVPQMASSVHRMLLDREAKLDPLTEVPVRRVLESRLQALYRRTYEEGTSFAVIMCDIDHFKRVNDTWGHAAGDEALILVARALAAGCRDRDLCCRFGGEEFTVLLEETSGEQALQLADRLRRAVEQIELVYDGQPIPLTLSAGVAAFPELHIKTPGELLLLADEALYEAKDRGRNRCLLNVGRNAYVDVSGQGRPATSTAILPPRIFG